MLNFCLLPFINSNCFFITIIFIVFLYFMVQIKTGQEITELIFFSQLEHMGKKAHRYAIELRLNIVLAFRFAIDRS